MILKRKLIVIVALTLCGIAILVWAIGNYMVKEAENEQYQQALAQRFDQVYDIACPLVESYALSLSDKVDSIETMGQKAMTTDSAQYRDAYYKFWQRYKLTEAGRRGFILSEEYQYLKISPVYGLLMNSGEKRQRETEAIQKITWAGQMLLEPVGLEYDSLMTVTKQARQFLSEGIEVLKPYHSENSDIHAWRKLQ